MNLIIYYSITVYCSKNNSKKIMPGKVKYHNLPEKERIIFLGDFYSIVSTLNGRDEAKSFFKDLLTLSEITMIARRIQIAKLLLSGKTHDEIRKKLKVGFSTIVQVDKWLNNGFGGYKAAIKKLNKQNADRERKFDEPPMPHSFDWVRKKYPLQFMLVNLMMDKNKKSKKDK
jgi:TrpR-related protein YerC/YecD